MNYFFNFQNLEYKPVQTSKSYASVAILIYENSEILFIKRSYEMPTHKGQIAFPGGRYEQEDKSIVDTATREACEELLIDNSDIEPFGIMNSFDTVEYKFAVYPVLCNLLNKSYSFNKKEVQNAFYVPIDNLMNKNNWNYRGRYEGDWVYHIEDEVLWGATANMVKRLFNLNLA